MNVSKYTHLCLHRTDQQTDGHNIYRVDIHKLLESSQKESDINIK